jgi:hypothetical protein
VAKRTKLPTDANQRGKTVVDLATALGEHVETEPPRGQAGGVKGGKARAKKLTAEQRSEIARKAAEARWGRSSSDSSPGV